MSNRHRSARRGKILLHDALNQSNDCGDCPHIGVGCPDGQCQHDVERAFDMLAQEQQARARVQQELTS